MYTLTIPQIFKNISYYQNQYLNILENPELYFTSVEGASIDVWPFGYHALYLGDLLQLWFGDKWIEHFGNEPLINTILRDRTQIDPSFDHYIYAIAGNALTGQNTTQSWSNSIGQSIELSLDKVSQYYCVFKGLTRPKKTKDAKNLKLKTVL